MSGYPGCRQIEDLDSGSWWLTLGFETNCIKQLEGKLVQITGIPTIILQILTTKRL